MKSSRIRRVILPMGLAGTIALVAIAGNGATATAKPTPDKFAAQAQSALNKGQYEKAITLAEAVVAASPREPAYRALLAQAYLKAGRFDSAATTFDDAMKLGDNSARSALGLALSNVAAGRNQQAVAVLDDWRDAIPASDLGLALALAGETGRGVAILTDALRGGTNNANIRQNLAYAFALDGRWKEARLMMEQDVSADLVDNRVSEWAATARPEDHKARIAGLLKAPLRADSGQPTQLALNAVPAAEQLAAESAAIQAQPEVVAAVELPPTDTAPAVEANPTVLANYAPVTSVPLADVREPSAPVAAPATVARSESFATAFSATPVSQPVPQASVAPNRTRVAVRAPVRNAPQRTIAKGGSHNVQLGSFSSAQGARRAWGIFAAKNPELRNFRMTITPAVVRGKNFWRVAAAGFEAKSATGMCSRVKARGGVCFAYTALPARAAGPALAKVTPRKASPAKVAPKSVAQARPATAAGPALARRH